MKRTLERSKKDRDLKLKWNVPAQSKSRVGIVNQPGFDGQLIKKK